MGAAFCFITGPIYPRYVRAGHVPARGVPAMTEQIYDQEGQRPRGYDGVGMSLAAARQRLGLSREEVADRLRIRSAFLEAIERGRFEQLPGRTYALGFLRAYGEFLGLDPDAVIEAYRREGIEGAQASPYQFRMPKAEHRTPRIGLVLVMLAVAVLAYAGWRYAQEFGLGDLVGVPAVPDRLAELVPPPKTPEPAPAATTTDPAATPPASTQPEAPPATTPPATTAMTPPAAVPPPAPGPAPAPATTAPPAIEPTRPPAPAPTPAPAAEAPPPLPATGAVYGGENADSRVVIRAKADSWVQVYGPGEEMLLSRILRAGDSYKVPNRADLRLTTGNAGALEILIEGQALPPLGAQGQVRRNIPLDGERLRAAAANPPPPPPPARRETPTAATPALPTSPQN